MFFLKKLHSLSIHALNLCAIATLASLALNILTAVGLFLSDHMKKEQ